MVVNHKTLENRKLLFDYLEFNQENSSTKNCFYCGISLFLLAKYHLCNNCFQSKNNIYNDKLILNSRVSTNQRITNILNGKIAQTLIEEMFREMGYTVINTGLEENNGQLTNYCRKKTKNQSNSVIKIIRETPDLVIINEDYGIEEAIEVKFRADGKFRFSRNYNSDYCYNDAYLVLVSPRFIKIQQVRKLKEGEQLIFFNYFQEFPVDKNIVIKYVELIREKEPFILSKY